MEPLTQSPDDGAPGPGPRRYPLGVGIRLVVFGAIVVCGILGYVIAYNVAAVASTNDACPPGRDREVTAACREAHSPGAGAVLWGAAGAVVGVGGSAVVCVLLARSFGEWAMLRAGGPSRETDHGDSLDDAGPRTC